MVQKNPPSFCCKIFLIRCSWNFMNFPRIYLGHFSENFFEKSHTYYWWRHHSWTLVSWSFSCKKVSIFCIVLCCSCLKVGVIFYRILHVTKLTPNYYSHWRHNDVIIGKTSFFSTKVCRKFTETLCNLLILLVVVMYHIMMLLWQHHVIMTS